jgi:predicted phage tail protein
MLRNIHLYGTLKKQFGSNYKFDVASIAETMRAFRSQVPKLYESMRQGEYAVVRGEDLNGEQLNLDMCKTSYGKGDFHIVPVVAGSGSGKGWFSILAGVALVALAIFAPPAGYLGAGILTAQTLGTLGVGLVLAGIGTLMAPDVGEAPSPERPDERASFIFTGATNRIEQGGPLCLIYGRTFIGSTVVAASYETEEI